MFNDESKIAPWALASVKRVVDAGLMRGDDAGNFSPEAPITRQEFAVVLDREILMAVQMYDMDLQDMLRSVADKLVQVNAGNALGSGVVIAPGYVLTNAHVVADNKVVEVLFTSPFRTERLPGYVGPMCDVVAVDADNDLALIEVDDSLAENAITVASDWSTTDLRQFVGRHVFTQGSPLGFAGRVSEHVFNGIRFYDNVTFLDIDGHINGGNSGGAIINARGELVGIVVAKLVDESIEGMGFGIPLYRILPFLRDNGIQA